MSKIILISSSIILVALMVIFGFKSSKDSRKELENITAEVELNLQQEEENKLADSNKEKETSAGFSVKDIIVGEGQKAQRGDILVVHYNGYLENGTKFDSSIDRGQPLQFRLGAGQVIRGWDVGLEGMNVGGKRKLILPPDWAYGEQGASNVIPPNATLIFEVDLLNMVSE